MAHSEYPIFKAGQREPYRARLVSLRGPNWVGEVRYDREGIRQDEPYVTEFSATDLGGTKTISPLTPSTLLWPQAFIFFAGDSPRGLCGIEWHVVNTSGNRVTLEAHTYDPSFKPINALFKNRWDFKLVVDADKVIPLDFQSSENGLPREHTTILESKRIEGIWLPSRIESSFTLGGSKQVLSETRTTWTLDEVKPTGNLELPIPLHSSIGDYRLESPDLHPWLFPPPGAQPVQYRWNGTLPSLDELRSMKAGHPRPTKSEGVSIWLFGGPFALAAGAGMMLIYRKRLAR